MAPHRQSRPDRQPRGGRPGRRWNLLVAAVVCLTLSACGSTLAGQVGAAGGSGGGLSLAPGQSSAGATSETGTATGSSTGTGPGTSTGTAATQGGTAGSTATTTGSSPTTTTSSDPSGTTVGGAAGVGAIPATGPGWNQKTIYIGVTTQQDVQSVAQAAGINSVNSGNQKADAEAMIATINAKGGLFGRKLQGLYYDTQSTGNAETQGQAVCEFFTKDNHVIALFAAALVADTPAFRSCMAAAHVPVFAGGGQAFDDEVFKQLDGYYNLMPFPSWTSFAPAFVHQLKAENYFTPWNTTLGRAGTGAVKVGTVCPDTPVGARVSALMSKALSSVGDPPAQSALYAASETDISNIVLQFKADGITHVLWCDLDLFVFAIEAQTQAYHPRYGVSTFNTPILFLQGTVPSAQLVGSIGSGFDPALDVDQADDPGSTGPPDSTQCVSSATKQGVTYPGDERFALAFLEDTCDVFNLVVDAAKAGHGLDGPAILAGVATVGPTFRSALTFQGALSATNHGMPGATREISYNTACDCYQYKGPNIPIS